ncbi:MAG: hypothetical protein CMD28_06300 [Flavobacteriales bacterium]|nr:hypothetical protein [Flavobacteriales bacterium]|tara:strand:+ start:270 stop:776 length:507 start_codon:yes stop_codon:yes gene_type:complete
MKFLVGDKVLFKNENLQGEIVKINSPYKVTVLSSDGFRIDVSVKDLVKIEDGSCGSSSYGENFDSKDTESIVMRLKKKKTSQSILKVDLHIESLISNYQSLDNFEITQIQLNECRIKIKVALRSKITKIEIIHGIGAGILRNEVHTILKECNLRFYLTEDGGATEVYL